MYLHEEFRVHALLLMLSCVSSISTTLESNESELGKILTTGKSKIVWFSNVLENIRGDIRKMETTMTRITEELETLETRWSYDLDGKQFNPRNTTNYLNIELLKDKLERIANTQERNSRIINIQMTSLTNLEKSFNRLENLHHLAANSNDDTNDPTLTFYQQKVVNHLISIEKELDKLSSVGFAAKDDNKNKENKDKYDGPSVTGYSEDYETLTGDSNAVANGRVMHGCESLRNSGLPSGIYVMDKTLKVSKIIWGNTSKMYCDLITDGGGWTVIQRRGEAHGAGRVNFTRSWNDYANGFGNLKGDFWLGNEVVHRLTTYDDEYELRIELEDWDRQTAWAQYSDFQLGTGVDGYRIRVSRYMGNATDSLSAHDSTPFSTFDRRNDLAPRCCPCTADYGGGWWYYSCFEANLNGDYYERDEYRQPFKGIIWEHWRGDYSLKSTKMMIRSKYHNSIDQA